MLKLACPLTSVAVYNVVVPSLKVTVPPGVPAPETAVLTVAVKITAWPAAEGPIEVVIVVRLAA